METEIKEKVCKNCRFYMEYYIKHDLKYKSIDDGHCAKTLKRKKLRFSDTCDLWEDNGIREEKRKETLKNTLIRISRKLDDIAEVFKEDF